MRIRSLFMTFATAMVGLALLAMALVAPQVGAQESADVAGLNPGSPAGVVPLGGDFFVHIATPETIQNRATLIDHPRLNGDPDAIFFATHVSNPFGAPVGISNPYNVGAYYSEAEEKWAVYNESDDVMTPYAAFNIFIPLNGSLSFVHTATADNINLNWTRIIYPPAQDLQAIVLAMHSYNAGGGGGQSHNHSIGVYYDTDYWAIFNQDGAAMVDGRDFNVFIVPPLQVAITHTTTAANSDGALTYLDHPLLNGHPGAITIVTQNWSLPDTYTYNDRPVGVLYDTVRKRWAIFNLDSAPMPEDAGFNVLIAPGRNHLPFFVND